jgi:hypothetical protein
MNISTAIAVRVASPRGSKVKTDMPGSNLLISLDGRGIDALRLDPWIPSDPAPSAGW